MTVVPPAHGPGSEDLIQAMLLREPWRGIYNDVRSDEHPSTEELAAAIRDTEEVPRLLAAYVAGRLDGSIRPPRGRPQQSKKSREAELVRLSTEYRLAFEGAKVRGERAAAAVATQAVLKSCEARHRHMTEATLQASLKAMKRASETARDLVPSKNDAQALFDLSYDEVSKVMTELASLRLRANSTLFRGVSSQTLPANSIGAKLAQDSEVARASLAALERQLYTRADQLRLQFGKAPKKGK